MASAVMHICVAKKVNEYLNFREKELFLGAIAPDISKQINEAKEKSHFINGIKDIPDINAFMFKYKDKIKTPFDYGYLIHLYTDLVWYSNLDKYIYGMLGEIIINSEEYKNSDRRLIEIFYNDYTNIGIKLIDEYGVDLSLFYEEFEIPNTCITEIPITKLNILIDKMGIIIENSHHGRSDLLDYSKVCSFIDDVSCEIIKFLKQNNL